jgi:hypothetical protein
VKIFFFLSNVAFAVEMLDLIAPVHLASFVLPLVRKSIQKTLKVFSENSTLLNFTRICVNNSFIKTNVTTASHDMM